MTKQFACTYPDCKKQFSRKDHLKRHEINHSNRFPHTCPVCYMRFRRADVKKEHYDKHFKPEGFKRQKTVELKPSKHHCPDPEPSLNPQEDNSLSSIVLTNTDWLFDDAMVKLDDNDFVNSIFFQNEANVMLNELLGADWDLMVSMLPNSSTVSLELMVLYSQLIPSLSQHPDFIPVTMEYCLKIYWELFHIQFPIIHKPLFNTLKATPTLTLAMIMMGSILSTACDTPSPILDPYGLALCIGSELRWLIFRQKTQENGNSLTLQSLLILEVFEKHYGSRELHERSSIHQAAKIEIMKRSVLLGGDPYAETKSPQVLGRTKEEKLLDKWIEAESMKRCLLMAFVFDLTNCVISSHTSLLFVDKLKLSLPCDDVVWESNLDVLKNITLIREPPTIRSCFKKLIQGECIETTSFGKKVLFHTLTSLMIQLEQKGDTLALLEQDKSDILHDKWRSKVAYAFDMWKFNVINGSCCNTDGILIDLRVRDKSDGAISSSWFHLNDTRCKFPVYHMSHIRLNILNHDLLIYAGVQKRMNVVANNQDYKNTEKRMLEWANSDTGRLGTVHAYLCLMECLLKEGKEYIEYSPEKDPIPERAHVIVDSCLTIWGFNHVIFGPESNCYSKGQIHYKETAYSYLRRTKKIFDSVVSERNARAYHYSCLQLAKSLDSIQNIHHVAGLMAEMAQMYSLCKWQLGKEYSRLFESCRDRSMGSQEIFCHNMYE